MSAVIASNDSLLDFAKFVSEDLLAKHREAHPDFPKDSGVSDVFAEGLVRQYLRPKNQAPIAIKATASGADFSGAEFSAADSESTDSKSAFPLDFDVNVVVGSLHGRITNPSQGEYLLTATFKILGKTLDEVEIRFKDGELSRTEEVGAFGQTVKTKFTIGFSNGFHLGIEGHVSNFFKDFDFGPYDIHL